MVKDAKGSIKKNIGLFKNRLKTSNDEVKNAVFTALVRSLIIYHLTPMKVAGMVTLDDIQRFETYLKR